MEAYSWYNVTIVLFAAFGSLFAGFSLSVIGFTLGQPTFYTSLGLESDPTKPAYSHTNSIIGAANGVFFGAGFFGCFLSGWAGNAFGRVNGFRIAALTGIVGGTLQAAAVNQAMYLVARAITGLAAGHTISAMPTYFSEVAPPHSRGLMTGAHGIFINVGYFMSGWIGFGCYFAPDTSFSWRFPISMIDFWGLCLICGSFYVPESPRYLVQKDRHQEALAILRRLHHDPHDPNDTFAHQELELIVQRHEMDRKAIESGGRWQIFTQKTYRQRLFLAWLVMAGGQNIGALVINNYNVLLYQSLGLSGVVSLLLAAVYSTTGLIGSSIGGLVADKLGRRKALVGGYVAVTAMFSTLTGLMAKFNETKSRGWASAATTFVYLYVLVYTITVDVNQFTLVTELFPSHLRSQATSFAISGLFVADILWLNLEPTATASIGWKYYLVFLCLGVVHAIHFYFVLPETSGRTLEEIEASFSGSSVEPIIDEQRSITTKDADN